MSKASCTLPNGFKVVIYRDEEVEYLTNGELYEIVIQYKDELGEYRVTNEYNNLVNFGPLTMLTQDEVTEIVLALSQMPMPGPCTKKILKSLEECMAIS